MRHHLFPQFVLLVLLQLSVLVDVEFVSEVKILRHSVGGAWDWILCSALPRAGITQERSLFLGPGPPSLLYYKGTPSFPSNVTREHPPSLLMLQGDWSVCRAPWEPIRPCAPAHGFAPAPRHRVRQSRACASATAHPGRSAGQARAAQTGLPHGFRFWDGRQARLAQVTGTSPLQLTVKATYLARKPYKSIADSA